jgi:hypothetical protein
VNGKKLIGYTFHVLVNQTGELRVIIFKMAAMAKECEMVLNLGGISA